MSSKVESLVVIKKEEESEHTHAAVFLPSKTSPEVAKDNADQKDMERTIAFLEAEILRKNKTIIDMGNIVKGRDNEIKWLRALFDLPENHDKKWRRQISQKLAVLCRELDGLCCVVEELEEVNEGKGDKE